jgi:integral membrane sensor domain MASE1
LHRRWLYVGQIVVLAALYYGLARLALAVAIPPGYATPIWPSSGIALAGLLVLGRRAWPGVWIGSFLANLPVDTSLFAAATIATGSALQAIVTAALVRRHLGIPYRFMQVQQVVKLVALTALGATR